MGRVTELIEYLNSKEENIEKRFTHLTITDKIAQARHELFRKNREKADVDSATAEEKPLKTVI